MNSDKIYITSYGYQSHKKIQFYNFDMCIQCDLSFVLHKIGYLNFIKYHIKASKYDLGKTTLTDIYMTHKEDMSCRVRFPSLWYVRPVKHQISMRIRAV